VALLQVSGDVEQNFVPDMLPSLFLLTTVPAAECRHDVPEPEQYAVVTSSNLFTL
jgi:hypothetical protein